MRNAKVQGWWCCLCFIALLVSGCPKTSPPPIQRSPGTDFSAPGSGLGESSLSASSPSPGETTQQQIESGPDRDSPLQDIYFAYDSFELHAEARNTLRANADWLQGNPQARVEIEGHCDERGTVEYNLALGAKRARAARDYLVDLGITPGRLSTISYGEELPLCREANESCWQQNRRSHFLVLNR